MDERVDFIACPAERTRTADRMSHQEHESPQKGMLGKRVETPLAFFVVHGQILPERRRLRCGGIGNYTRGVGGR